MADTVVATPRKMKPTADPDGQQKQCVALTEVAESQHCQDQRRSAADEQQHPPAGRDVQAEREYHLRDAGDQQVSAEEDRGDNDRLAWPRQHQNAEDDSENP